MGRSGGGRGESAPDLARSVPNLPRFPPDLGRSVQDLARSVQTSAGLLKTLPGLSKPRRVCSRPGQVCSKPPEVSSRPRQVCSKPCQVCSKPWRVRSRPWGYHRTTRISTGSPRSGQIRSVVIAGRPRTAARARQARSPRERPAWRVADRSRAVVSARTAVKGRIASPKASRSYRSPSTSICRSRDFCMTSDQFTLEIAAVSRSSCTTSPPGSSCSMASRAEASSTQLRSSAIRLAFPPRFGPPLGDELVRETDPGGDVREALAQPPEHGLPLLEHEAAVLDGGDEGVSGNEAKLAADLGRDHEAALGSDGNSGGSGGLSHGCSMPQDAV